MPYLVKLCDITGEWYNKSTTITLITTFAISLLLGTLGPISSPGVNFPVETGKKLYSQITSKLQKNSLSEVNPMEALGNVTAPLDDIFKAIKERIGGFEVIKDFLDGVSSRPSKTSLEGRFGLGDTLPDTSVGGIIDIIKSSFILVANILVAVLEIAVSVLRGILSLIS